MREQTVQRHLAHGQRAGAVTLKPLRATGEQPNPQKRVSVDAVADEIMSSILDWEES